ncbi:hypothetical protein K456DRAFT_397321 [Colletotrichum gloeosporioides 23]|nr:hypothetical protein K456DRAFT_397321 [Colletotrichum gloeosporioides 23]
MNEADIYGQTPLHLAATRPRILAVLVEAADHELLGKTDITGATALDTAMIRSSSFCVNGSTYQRCRRCACTQSVEILLRAGCNPRWHKRQSADGTCDLFFVLGCASELARRRYVFQMKLLQHLHKRRACDTSRRGGGYGFLKGLQDASEHDYEWAYYEVTDPRIGHLFYRYGIKPQASYFINSTPHQISGYRGLTPEYMCWLEAHGADLFLPSSTMTEGDLSGAGIYGAHYAFYSVAWKMMHPGGPSIPAAFDKLSATVIRRGLTDGCHCHCSTGGCSPFTWMMKCIMAERHRWVEPVSHMCTRSMAHYYSRCSPDLTRLTYMAAIRYATFDGLGLRHTCCNAYSTSMKNKAHF